MCSDQTYRSERSINSFISVNLVVVNVQYGLSFIAEYLIQIKFS